MSGADWFILAGVAVIAIVDVIFVVRTTPTISRRFRSYGYRVSFFPYAWGVLGGHFWGPDLDPLLGNWWASVGILLSAGGVLSLVHWLLLKLDPPDWTPLLYIPAGVVAGVFMWPQ